jgi:GTPase SAR1 family protein
LEKIISGEKAYLKALSQADLNWVSKVDGAWSLPAWDVPDIHLEVREAVDSLTDELSHGRQAQLGRVVLGQGGAGKTHVLSYLCRRTLEKGGYFILADMSNIKVFWDTFFFYLRNSLEQKGIDGREQKLRLVEELLKTAMGRLNEPLEQFFYTANQANLSDLTERICNGLFILNSEARLISIENRDLIRALVFFNSRDSNLYMSGYNWLQGSESLEWDMAECGFKKPLANFGECFSGLSRLIALSGSFMSAAIDQLDAVIGRESQNKANEGLEENTKSICSEVAGGLAAMVNTSQSVLTVITLLFESWQDLNSSSLSSLMARFDHPLYLTPIKSADKASRLIANRLGQAYLQAGLKVAYPSWPFLPEAFKDAENFTPRELLKKVANLVDNFKAEGRVYECNNLGGCLPQVRSLTNIDDFFNKKRQESELGIEITDNEEGESKFWIEIVKSLFEALVASFDEGDVEELLFGSEVKISQKSLRPNYACAKRFKAYDKGIGRSLSLWVILPSNAKSFQSRLKEALTQSGIDSTIGERKLAVIRFKDPPSGTVTAKLVSKFNSLGGEWVKPSLDDLKLMSALTLVRREYENFFKSWAKERRPIFELKCLSSIFNWFSDLPITLSQESPKKEASSPKSALEVGLKGEVPESGKAKEAPGLAPEPESGFLIVGSKVSKGERGSTVFLEANKLLTHTVIFGATGSGKTVLLKRITEEAALAGTPAVIIDGAGDLTFFGERWEKPHIGWLEGDEERARKFFSSTETVIWTPALSSGNPLRLALIPDFTYQPGGSEGEEQLSQWVNICIDALRDILKTKGDHKKEGVLAWALKYMVKCNTGQGFAGLVELLKDLPVDTNKELFEGAPKEAKKMSEILIGAAEKNPELEKKSNVEIADLFQSKSGKTRISVISLMGLVDNSLKQRFVNKLLVSMFAHIVKNPGQGLSGLLVIDEAHNYAPSLKSTPTKTAVAKFANEARKYGYGLILASQALKSLENSIITNFSNVFVGKLGTDADIKSAKNMLNFEGVGHLQPTNFYCKSTGLKPPHGKGGVIISPMSLSRHPSNQPNSVTITEMALKSKIQILDSTTHP